jgi:hypothetical protein
MVDEWIICMEHWWCNSDRTKLKRSEREKLSQWPVHHTWHTDWLGIEPGPPRWSIAYQLPEKPWNDSSTLYFRRIIHFLPMTWRRGDYLRDNSRTPSLRTSHFSCKSNLHFSSPPQYFLPPHSHLCSSYTSSSSTRSFVCQTAATFPRHLYHYQCRTNCGKQSEIAGPVRESVLPAVASRPALTASRGSKAHHSPSSSAAVNNAWSSASSPLRHHENVLHEGQRQHHSHWLLQTVRQRSRSRSSVIGAELSGFEPRYGKEIFILYKTSRQVLGTQSASSSMGTRVLSRE